MILFSYGFKSIELEGKVSPEGIFQAIHSIQILDISSIHKPFIPCWQEKKNIGLPSQ
jgi:hypothetical protein